MSEVYTQGKALLVSTTLEPAYAHTKTQAKTIIKQSNPAAEDVPPVEISSEVVAPAATSSTATAMNNTQYMPGGTRYQSQQTSSVSSSGTSSSTQADGMSNLVDIMERQCDYRNTSLFITSTQYSRFQWKSFGLPVFHESF